jgi:peptide/nickel transport system ATP-binding protein
MQYGKVVEVGTTLEMFENPQHQYTRELLSAVPGKGWKKESSNAKPIKK